VTVFEASAIDDVADTFFRAMEGSDVALIEELLDEDVLIWHTGDREDNRRDRALRIIYWFLNRTSERRYQILDRQLFDNSTGRGFVQQHVLHATGDHGTIALRVCIVVKLGSNGLIGRIDEYLDPADLAPLLQ